MAECVKHIVLVKFKDTVAPEIQKDMITRYTLLPSTISTMKGFEWGTDVSEENMQQGFTHVFISTFDSKEGRDEYLVHPHHQAYAKELIPCLEKVLAIDFSPTVTMKAPSS